MQGLSSKHWYENSFNYHESLNRIINKYSNFQEEEFLDVDLHLVDRPTLEKYFKESENRMCQMEAERTINLDEETHMDGSTVHDLTGDSEVVNLTEDDEADLRTGSHTQLSIRSNGGSIVHNLTGDSEVVDLTNEDDEADVRTGSLTQLSISDNEMTLLSDDILDESERKFFEEKLKVEEDYGKLDSTLNSYDSFMEELFPNMINRMGMVWQRQRVFNAADAILKRYRKFRLHPKRSIIDKTFVAGVRPYSVHTRKTSRGNQSFSCPDKKLLPKSETNHQSPLKMARSLFHPPVKAGSSPNKAPQQHILVMNFESSSSSEDKSLLNETFTVSEGSTSRSQLAEQSSSTTSPYHRRKSTGSSSPELKASLRPTRSTQKACCFACSPKSPAAKSCSSASCSPFRGPVRCHSSSPPKPIAPRLKPSHPQPIKLDPPSPRLPVTLSVFYHLQHRLSLDDSLPPISAHLSAHQLDVAIKEAYHKYVCLKRDLYPDAPPCRLCAEGSKDSRGHSSSNLSALALSPHGPSLKKRMREQSCDSPSKRLREEYCTHSPGSKRHGQHKLRRRLNTEEVQMLSDVLPSSPGRHGRPLSRRFSGRQLTDHRRFVVTLN